MKNNKKITLFKAVSMIIIVVIVSVVTVLIISKIIKESKNNLYYYQIKMIEKNSEKWGMNNISKLSNTEVIYLNLSELIGNEYIKHPLKDPRNTNIELNGCILIKYNNLYSKYEYKYYESTCSELMPHD